MAVDPYVPTGKSGPGRQVLEPASKISVEVKSAKKIKIIYWH
jgi:hypothetical protein